MIQFRSPCSEKIWISRQDALKMIDSTAVKRKNLDFEPKEAKNDSIPTAAQQNFLDFELGGAKNNSISIVMRREFLDFKPKRKKFGFSASGS